MISVSKFNDLFNTSKEKTKRFVEYIKSLGFSDIAGSKTINKAKSHAKWQSETNTITFHGISLSSPERKRRNMIAWRFLEMMNGV